MKILIVPDIRGWAIDNLAQAKIKYNRQHNWLCHYVHPRDAGEKNVQEAFLKLVREFNPDIIHFEYYRTCSQLLAAIPELRSRKIILTHHNQRTKALREYDWFMNGVDHIVTHTKNAKKYLVEQCGQPEKFISVINHGINLTEFHYDSNEPLVPKVGYVGRIVPWKGLKEIARACKELGYVVQVMGKMDKESYWQDILREGLDDVLDFSYFDCPNEQRYEAYKNMTIYVGNSIDGYEEGTLPYLEAMACGVPVVTTPNGVANDIGEDQVNCLMVDFGDYDGLKTQIKRLMSDKELRDKLRENAWETVKNMPEEKMANEYNVLYHKVRYPKDELFSIVIPITFDRIDLLEKSLQGICDQTYKNSEVCVVFDEELSDATFKKYLDVSKDIRVKFGQLTIKTAITGNPGYGLAEARNIGAIMSDGKYLLFLDSRLLLDGEALEVFYECLENVHDKIWYFGDKGGNKKSFVENFSAIKREHFFTFGMFNERINAYGGMSQEVRTRWSLQGGSFKYMNDARAIQLKKAKKDWKRRLDIINMKELLRRIYRGKNF